MRCVVMEMPPDFSGGISLICVRRCPTFPPGLGSIIGAGRLSFRVRDGSGRFPAAVAAVTFFTCGVKVCLVVGCGVVCVDVWLRAMFPIHHFVVGVLGLL